VILQLLFQWKIVELPSESKLAIDFFLTDAEILNVEESYVLSGIFQLLREFLFTARFVELTEIECDELGPIHCRLLTMVIEQESITDAYGHISSQGLVYTAKEFCPALSRTLEARLIDGCEVETRNANHHGTLYAINILNMHALADEPVDEAASKLPAETVCDGVTEPSCHIMILLWKYLICGKAIG
jgi:hypothetical protein